MNYLVERLLEKSTWQGIAAIVTAFGVSAKPELTEAIITVGISVAALAQVLWPEVTKVEEAKK